MPLLPRFDPPAFLRDVPDASVFYDQWSSFISSRIAAVTPGDGSGAFYNPLYTDVSIAAEKTLTWMGFPRDVLLSPAYRDNRHEAYREAELDTAGRNRQNEYFEWRTERNTSGKITRVIFVTEFPEYYERLWMADRSAVVAIYRNLVSPLVNETDLHVAGMYNRHNRWNTTDGIVHYIQSINTLSAALGLATTSVRSAPPFRDNYEAMPGGASAFTSVDPRVSFDVHTLVRKGLYITLRNPVGIYITGWDNSGIAHPDGTPAPSYWRIVRGVPGMVLRLEYAVPPGRGFEVGDLTLGGRRIEYGGQLAEQITVSLTGIAGTPL